MLKAMHEPAGRPKSPTGGSKLRRLSASIREVLGTSLRGGGSKVNVSSSVHAWAVKAQATRKKQQRHSVRNMCLSFFPLFGIIAASALVLRELELPGEKARFFADLHLQQRREKQRSQVDELMAELLLRANNTVFFPSSKSNSSSSGGSSSNTSTSSNGSSGSNTTAATLTVDFLRMVVAEQRSFSLTHASTLPTNSSTPNLNWHFPSALFFVTTIVTTVGYGTFSPVTDGGKAFTVVLALIGISYFGFVLTLVSEQLLHMVRCFSLRCCKCKSAKKRKAHTRRSSTRRTLCFATAVMLAYVCGVAAGCVLLGWAIGDAFYFSFITFTTIGLGDFAPQFDSNRTQVVRLLGCVVKEVCVVGEGWMQPFGRVGCCTMWCVIWSLLAVVCVVVSVSECWRLGKT